MDKTESVTMPDRLKEELADFWGEKKMQDRIAQLEAENKRLREALRWQNVELRERIARALHRPRVRDNDALRPGH